MISAVVLAAGRSARLGEPKQLLKAGKKTVLETVIHRFEMSGVEEVVLVLGYRADEILKKSEFGDARVVVNLDYEQGLASSLRVGIDAINPGASAVIVALGDQPLLSVHTIDSLLEKYSETHGLIVAPFLERRRGNPVLFDKSLFPELRKMQGDEGAKGVIERMKDKVVKVQVEDFGVLLDIDTEEDYLRFREKFGN